jgi:hypothetical protein
MWRAMFASSFGVVVGVRAVGVVAMREAGRKARQGVDVVAWAGSHNLSWSVGSMLNVLKLTCYNNLHSPMVECVG